MIETGGGGRLWVLSGRHSGYALHLTDRDELIHLHWGPRIAVADAEALAAEPEPPERGFESPLDGREEYPVEGGPRFARPALSVQAQGTTRCGPRTTPIRCTGWPSSTASASSTRPG
ncbi:hypothetical protein PS467_33085 [Streptomyces luomodiensis]|uniref:Uncharacterized protein n=1 Tax=Streptomyces luomodiensis TaxID=3026192 RepID=A0ABY9VAT7_9ACTN|nr:hypothetical protein [Streptomyces sp. SCA4-21]WNE99820.1 hypothetical protein PS467_33085 [Streptomyces sp. SCA4-21]